MPVVVSPAELEKEGPSGLLLSLFSKGPRHVDPRFALGTTRWESNESELNLLGVAPFFTVLVGVLVYPGLSKIGLLELASSCTGIKNTINRILAGNALTEVNGGNTAIRIG